MLPGGGQYCTASNYWKSTYCPILSSPHCSPPGQQQALCRAAGAAVRLWVQLAGGLLMTPVLAASLAGWATLAVVDTAAATACSVYAAAVWLVSEVAPAFLNLALHRGWLRAFE